ncbi:MAG TPA: hypothetical protein VGN26_12575 [Armatimonadota bacterium]
MPATLLGGQLGVTVKAGAEDEVGGGAEGRSSDDPAEGAVELPRSGVWVMVMRYACVVGRLL